MRKKVSKYLTKLAKDRGYEIIPFWKMDDLSLVNHLRKVLEHFNVEVVIDVGANQGQFYDLLRREIGFRGQILSFEPVSRDFKMLAARSAGDKICSIYNFALGSEQGEAEINVARSPGLNSFLAPRKDIVSGFWKDGSIIGVEKVQVRKLDEVLGETGIDCSKQGVYLKLDTQGFDLEVLKGTKRSLPNIRGLQTEASIRPIYQGMPTYIEAINAMNESGFDLSGMFPVTHDEALRVIELDFMFINRKFASMTSPSSATFLL